jgi:iron complex transport system ATP-binding protein
MAAVVKIEDLAVDLGGRPILRGVSLEAKEGGLLAVVGPNGSGKTTLLRTIYRAVRPLSGRVLLDGRDVADLDQRAIGRAVGVLRQEASPPFDFGVEELVMMGRSPYKSLLDADTAEDHAIVRRSLELTDTLPLARRSFLTLSGGERQRVLLARALAQKPRILLLDEPTNHLDVRHQLDVLDCVKRLGITVIAALHDLNLALSFAAEAVVLCEGRVDASGSPETVLDPERIRRVFGVEVRRADGVLAFSLPAS